MLVMAEVPKGSKDVARVGQKEKNGEQPSTGSDEHPKLYSHVPGQLGALCR